MKEIKFRAWDINNNKLINVGGLHFYETPDENGAIGELFPVNERYSGYIGGELEEYILMQYTGLKDKNGIGIYKGDIVVHNCGIDHWTNDLTEKTSVIVWKEGKFHCGEGGWVINWHITSKADVLEVIGNIYENPDKLNNL